MPVGGEGASSDRPVVGMSLHPDVVREVAEYARDLLDRLTARIRKLRPARLEEEGVHDSNYYGISTGIAGLLLGLAVIAFMFAVADGFS